LKNLFLFIISGLKPSNFEGLEDDDAVELNLIQNHQGAIFHPNIQVNIYFEI